MKLLGETRPSIDTCPSTSLCIKTCNHDLKLGPKGSDGCPSCACVKSGNDKNEEKYFNWYSRKIRKK